MCFGFTDEIPSTVKELDLMTRDAYLKSAQRDQNIEQIAIIIIELIFISEGILLKKYIYGF